MQVYRSIGEMIRDNKKLNNMTQKDLLQLEKKIRRNRKILLVIIIILIIIFKCTVGYIRVNIYTFHKGYEVSLNNEYLSYQVSEEYTSPIIPFFIQFYNYFDAMVYVNASNILENDDKYILSIKEYECYNRSYEHNVSCDSARDILKKDSNYVINYLSNNNYKMNIKDSSGKIIYNGKFIKDITKYLNADGYYFIEIMTKKNNIKTNIKIEIKK
jgi:hypothetical protein